MKVEMKRTVKKEVEEIVELELKKFWVVRIIQGEHSKKCIFEKEFKHSPNYEEIAECLLPYYEKSCFATVEENYRLVS